VTRDPLDVPGQAKSKNSVDVNGVPFYIKVGKCKQETSWLQPFYTLTLKKTSVFKFVDEKAAEEDAAKNKLSKPKPPDPIVRFTVTKVLSLSQFDTSDVRNLRGMLAKPGPADLLQARAIEDTWKLITDMPDYLPLTISEDALLSSRDAFETSNTS
jgi:hypothetical protein